MGTEIERKFLVDGNQWKDFPATLLRQGYVCREPDRVVRVRTDGRRGVLTIKGPTSGMSRPEFEYVIPLPDADELLDGICVKPLIEKRRYVVEYRGKKWEVDEFLGENQGLVVAEIELQSEDEVVERPEWVGPEVTDDPRYYNANLVDRPYSRWDSARHE